MVDFIKQYTIGTTGTYHICIWSWSYADSYGYLEMLVNRAMTDYPTLNKDDIAVRLLKTGVFAIEFNSDNLPNDDYNQIPEPHLTR